MYDDVGVRLTRNFRPTQPVGSRIIRYISAERCTTECDAYTKHLGADELNELPRYHKIASETKLQTIE